MIQKFKDIKPNQLLQVGGKGLSLAKMAQANFPIPPGFVVTTEAFDKFGSTKPTQELIDLLEREFDELGAERVAVRSSAIAEDSSAASWAGQLESYLNVEKDDLMEAVNKCWGSIGSDRVQQYATRQKTDKNSLKVAVVVQAMVNSDVAGVMFTANPVTGDKNELMIEASFGLGEMIVQGEITPDNYIVNEKSEITSKAINLKDKMMAWRDGKNATIKVPSSRALEQAMDDSKILELAGIGRKIENYYGSPQDIEWCLEAEKLLIVQARPITTLNDITKEPEPPVSDQNVVATGIGASKGLASGKVRVIKHLGKIKDIVEGEILVTHKTTPDYIEAFSKVAGVVTESGGATSHAAIVSRELGIPAVVGTGDILLKVKDGDIVTVDGFTGYVYAGKVEARGATETEFVAPKPTGDDIQDMINAIATGTNDANELWPLSPVQLMSYIDADQSVDMYVKLKKLVESGMDEKNMAKLFERPVFIKMFLLNTGIPGIKTANVFGGAVTVGDQISFVSLLLRLAKILNHDDENYIVSRNYLLSKDEVGKFIYEMGWREADYQLARAVNLLSVNLLALNWALYWDYFPDAGHELHGPYEAPSFGFNSRMVIKDYFNLGSGDVWEHAKDFPYKDVRLAQIYDTDKMYINFGNRLIGDNLSNHTTHFALLVNGEPVKSLSQIQEISAELKILADKQAKHVNQLEPMELVRKGAKISYFTRKKFYAYFNKNWYPEAMIEATINELGAKFVEDKSEVKPMSLEVKQKMWDPRTDYLPWA